MVDHMIEQSDKAREDLRLFGVRNSKIKEYFPYDLLAMQIYFFMACLSFPAGLFILYVSMFFRATSYSSLLFIAYIYAPWAIYGMYRVKVFGFAAIPIFGVFAVTLWDKEKIGLFYLLLFLFGSNVIFSLWATSLAWRTRRWLRLRL